MASQQERIFRKCQPVPESGCWLWTGAVFNTGRPQIRVSGKVVQAHRRSFEVFVGRIPDGMVVCHKCDTPLCVNPDHLFVGTRADNNLDRDRKGRHKALRAEENGSARLTWEEVRRIRRLHSSGVPTEDIGPLFGVTGRQIRNIVRNKQWVVAKAA